MNIFKQYLLFHYYDMGCAFKQAYDKESNKIDFGYRILLRPMQNPLFKE